MSTNVPFIEEVTLIAAKAETTTGTAIALTATEADIITYGADIVPDDNVNARQLPGDQGSNTATVGLRTGKATFSVDLVNSGSAATNPKWADYFLPACNWSDTATPAAGGSPTAHTFVYCRTATTLTIGKYDDGVVKILYGARGTFTIDLNAGTHGKVNFEFTGKYKELSDTAILAPTLPTAMPPVFGDTGTSVTIASTYSPIVRSLQIQAGNNVIVRQNANQGDGTALRGGAITNGQRTFSMEVEAEATSARDWRGILDAKTEEALSVALGSGAGNIITIAAPRMQTTKAPRAAADGILVRRPSGQLNGNNPFSIAFS